MFNSLIETNFFFAFQLISIKSTQKSLKLEKILHKHNKVPYKNKNWRMNQLQEKAVDLDTQLTCIQHATEEIQVIHFTSNTNYLTVHQQYTVLCNLCCPLDYWGSDQHDSSVLKTYSYNTF